jgi:hypothetical protein
MHPAEVDLGLGRQLELIQRREIGIVVAIHRDGYMDPRRRTNQPGCDVICQPNDETKVRGLVASRMSHISRPGRWPSCGAPPAADDTGWQSWADTPGGRLLAAYLVAPTPSCAWNGQHS